MFELNFSKRNVYEKQKRSRGSQKIKKNELVHNKIKKIVIIKEKKIECLENASIVNNKFSEIEELI